MKTRTQIFVLAAVLSYLLTASALAEVSAITGTISKVTAYRGQALVTRTISVELAPGTSELIVGNLPAKIIPESLYAQTSENLTVLSVRYRERAVRADTREEVKALDAQIKTVRNQLRYAERDHKHGGNLWAKYDNIWKLAVDASHVDLNRGLLASEQIQSLAEYLQSKWNTLHQNALKLEDQMAELKEQLELLNRKRKALDTGRSRTEREAVLFIRKDGNKKAAIELSYLVNGANWLPQYNLRANPDKSTVLIEYNAVVNQTSGEDWNGVALSLSTAEPAMVAGAPVLEPMAVVLASRRPTEKPSSQISAGVPMQVDRPGGLNGRYIDRSKHFRELIKSRRTQSTKGAAAQKQLGQIAITNQALEFGATRKDLERMKEQISEIARIEGVSVTYNLPGKLSLPSRTDQQLVTVAAVSAEADFTLVATPLLTDYVYLQAELLNDSKTIFLPGPASMFRNGEFVGKSNLPIVTVGEKFTAGFGIDSQIQAVRELEDKKTRIQGGNRIDTYHYRIALSNYRGTPAELRLLDRLPSTDDNSIKIELLKTAPELSKNAEYLRTLRKKGILRWDMNLKPNSVDQNATVVNYSFTMEYDKNMQIRPSRAGN